MVTDLESHLLEHRCQQTALGEKSFRTRKNTFLLNTAREQSSLNYGQLCQLPGLFFNKIFDSLLTLSLLLTL